jgi:tight adherence protein B
VEIQREVGGDLAEVLDNVAVTLAERGHLKRHVESLAADGQMSSAVMMLLPFVVGGLISLKTPDYLAPLVVEPMGRVLSVVAVLLMVGGAFWLKKITKVAF